MKKEDRYPLLCLAIYALAFVIGAIKPVYFHDWILESILPVLFVLFLIFTYNKLRLSNLSYTLILVFLIFATIGSHYTYVGMPYTRYVSDFLNLSRNYYDRIVHFLFGVLMYLPLQEYYKKIFKIKSKAFLCIMPIVMIMLAGVVFELLEGIVALVFNDPQLMAAYLALQGERFIIDSIKDLWMKLIGGLLSAFFLILKRIDS